MIGVLTLPAISDLRMISGLNRCMFFRKKQPFAYGSYAIIHLRAQPKERLLIYRVLLKFCVQPHFDFYTTHFANPSILSKSDQTAIKKMGPG